jgi:hypothetical protein
MKFQKRCQAGEWDPPGQIPCVPPIRIPRPEPRFPDDPDFPEDEVCIRFK